MIDEYWKPAYLKFGWWRFLLSAIIASTSTVSASDTESDFESGIAPLLIRRCVECHQGSHPSGGLLLTTRKGLHDGGESGPVIDLHNADDSYLVQRIVDGEMPPAKQGRSQKLTGEEIEQIRQWIADGAAWPEVRQLDYFERTNDERAGRDWWSLQPVVRPELPQLVGQPQPHNPIDAFVWAKLEAENITPAPQADRRTLIRRAYFDLIGLPPTEAEIAAFLADDSPDAWPQLIDRLLDMPQYGERWARYWLDLARYADTSGYERDQEKPFAWKYRDWVVKAFNSDMPYDQFIMQQIAGDELPNRCEESVIGTGFLRLGAWNDEPNDKLDYQYERLEDLVHTTSSAFLALTVKCARCHSHKFDAITQEDYYRMASAFWAGPVLESELGGPTVEQLGFHEVLGWTDVAATPKPLHILRNGERHHPLEEVIPASLSTIPLLEHRFEPPPAGAGTSHRRLQLARWIADPRNPLTSRVLVNRLWQHHFGQGIVRTPNNFGFLANPPTHPRLLDWLAAEFQSSGRRIKAMHRLILTSQTWQQSTLHPQADELEQRDSSNRLWWRSMRRRLDAETLRDSLLAVSGELDQRVGGEGFKPTISPEALEGLSRKSAAWQPSPPEQQKRRSLYMYLKRGLLPPMMTTFDLCDPTLSCGQRDVTIVPTQALALLNNRFVHDRSEQLATVISQSSSDQSEQVRQAWSRVLQRQASDSELNSALRYLASQTRTFAETDDSSVDEQIVERASETRSTLAQHLQADRVDLSPPKEPTRPSLEVLALASLCHALMNSNEFLFVD
ncbi:MAG: PSD1 and planctomycete cytochrome C domain-containing protein [Pirellulaceae bacterium]